MKFKDYVPLALRTESPGLHAPAFVAETANLRVLHAAIGLCTEAGELIRAVKLDDSVNVSEEIGDCCWYGAILADVYGWDLSDIENEDVPWAQSINKRNIAAYISVSASEILNECKRAMFYGKDMDLNQVKTQVRNIYRWCRWIGNEDFLEVNIAKLALRYPDKFTSDKAVNRDLNKERLVLEGK